jgi:hypothetical protein
MLGQFERLFLSTPRLPPVTQAIFAGTFMTRRRD